MRQHEFLGAAFLPRRQTLTLALSLHIVPRAAVVDRFQTPRHRQQDFVGNLLAVGPGPQRSGQQGQDTVELRLVAYPGHNGLSGRT